MVREIENFERLEDLEIGSKFALFYRVKKWDREIENFVKVGVRAFESHLYMITWKCILLKCKQVVVRAFLKLECCSIVKKKCICSQAVYILDIMFDKQ